MPTVPRLLQPRAAQATATVPLAAWQSTVEIVAPDHHWPAPPLPAAAEGLSSDKRPLSSYAAVHAAERGGAPVPIVEPAFRPETTISAFHWPTVCRILWQQYAEQYERIAELLLIRAGREPGRGAVIGISSLHPGDGATTTLLCLAVALAARKHSTILVDANFRAPRLAAALGAEPTTTWQDVLQHGLPVAEAVIHAQHDGLDLLPLDARDPANREPNGAKLAAGLQSSITAGVLRYAYEIVLVDLGAILAPRSFTSIHHLIRNMRISTAIAVTDPKHAEPDDLTVAGELLDETDCELLGVIENRTQNLR